MRPGPVVRALVLAALVSWALAASGCKAKGNGIGTAPPSNPCPTTVVEGQPCAVADVCAAACGGVSGPVDGGTASYLYCPGGTGATWQCIASGDGGVLGSPDAPDADADAGDADVGDADADADAADSDASDADASDADAPPDGDTGEVDGAADADADGAVDLDADAGVDADLDADAPDGD
ncbi:MAG: hypothetical protein NVSMB47_16080 [Polyangiales bacterium]